MLMLRVQGMLAEAVSARPASPLPAQQHEEGSALKSSVELAAIQPASLGTPAVPDIMQAAEIPVRFYVCTSKQVLYFLILEQVWAQTNCKLWASSNLTARRNKGGSLQIAPDCNASVNGCAPS